MKTSALLLLVSTAASHAWPIYQLHEWGTFTTVAGSDGTLLPGLEREEETLPAFAHAHIGFENGQAPDPAELTRIYQKHGTLGIPSSFKGLGERPLAGVTVKMETPVIYFHSNEIAPIRAKVKVGFNGGTISQWYPQRSGGEKLPEPPPSPDPVKKPTPISAWTLDFNKPYQGAIEWDIDILTPDQTRDAILFKPGDNVGWLRARQPVTNAVRTTSGEMEGYLFYRGVGRFDPGLKTTVSADETLHLENLTGGNIPYLIAFETIDGQIRWTEKTGGLETGGAISIAESDLKTMPAGITEPLYRAMKTGLAKCGLTDLEARSMVETWWKSYFEAPGLAGLLGAASRSNRPFAAARCFTPTGRDRPGSGRPQRGPPPTQGSGMARELAENRRRRRTLELFCSSRSFRSRDQGAGEVAGERGAGRRESLSIGIRSGHLSNRH